MAVVVAVIIVALGDALHGQPASLPARQAAGMGSLPSLSLSARAFCQGLEEEEEWKRVGAGNGLFTAPIVSLALHWANFNSGEGGGGGGGGEASRVRNLCPSAQAQFQPLFADRPSTHSSTYRRQALLHLRAHRSLFLASHAAGRRRVTPRKCSS